MVTSPDVTQVAEQLAGILQGQRSIETVPSATPEMAPSIATCGPDECTTLVSEDTVQRVKVGSYFSLWFALSTGYAVCNKRATNALPLPWLVANIARSSWDPGSCGPGELLCPGRAASRWN